MDLHDFRSNYSLGKLSKSDLDADPIVQFNLWLQQTIETGIKDPTAMVVATVDANGQPSQRYVLLKKVDERGFVFFTDTSSAKGQQISQNPQVSLLFPWHQYERQVRVQGIAERLPKDEVEQYFHSRPIGSQLAAATSQQSQVIGSRDELLNTFKELEATVVKATITKTTITKETIAEEKVPLPERWGGYFVKPETIEFWQGGEHRLHDRFVYSRHAQGWKIQRLQP